MPLMQNGVSCCCLGFFSSVLWKWLKFHIKRSLGACRCFRGCQQTTCMFWFVEKMRYQESGCFCQLRRKWESHRRPWTPSGADRIHNDAFAFPASDRMWSERIPFHGLWRASVASEMQLLHDQAGEKRDRWRDDDDDDDDDCDDGWSGPHGIRGWLRWRCFSGNTSSHFVPVSAEVGASCNRGRNSNKK